MPEKMTVIESPLSPDALLALVRTDKSSKGRTELPADLQAVGIRGAKFKARKDGSFLVLLDGVRANGITGADVEGRGHIRGKREGRGSEIVLTIEAGSLTKWKAGLVCVFCFGSNVKLWSPNGFSIDALIVTAAGAMLLLFFLRLEVSRLCSQVWPGLVHLVERFATGSSHVSSEIDTRSRSE